MYHCIVSTYVHKYMYIYMYKHKHIYTCIFIHIDIHILSCDYIDLSNFGEKHVHECLIPSHCCICQLGALQNKQKKHVVELFVFQTALFSQSKIIKLRINLWYHLKVSSFCLLGLEFPTKKHWRHPQDSPPPIFFTKLKLKKLENLYRP